MDWSLCPQARSVLRPGFVEISSATKTQGGGKKKKTPSEANIKTRRRQFIMDLLTKATSESESETAQTSHKSITPSLI